MKSFARLFHIGIIWREFVLSKVCSSWELVVFLNLRHVQLFGEVVWESGHTSRLRLLFPAGRGSRQELAFSTMRGA